jgi:hypothetical protein
MVTQLESYDYVNKKRGEFIEQFSRENINRAMAESILLNLEKISR